MNNAGFAVSVFPAEYPIEKVMEENFDGYFLSNGPGDPEPVSYGIHSAKTIIANKKPLFGICLGHQIIGLALGRKTTKLKFGHRGGNQPVKNIASGRVEITAQNHGFAVIEGIKSSTLPVMAVQYHPESSPGPHDAEYLFKEFFEMVKKSKA